MKPKFIPFIFAALLLSPVSIKAELTVVYHKPYADLFGHGPQRLYTHRISAMVPAPCNASFIVRSASSELPGDYFWPATSPFPNDSIERPIAKERKQIIDFLEDYFPDKFRVPILLDSAYTYNYKCWYTADSIRHEFYLMLSEADTFYVISGWFGKFMSFFRAVPSDTRLTPRDLTDQAMEIAPGLGKLGLSDSLVKIDTSLVWNESDERLYFLEAYDKAHGLRLRHYPINVVLPPEDPQKGNERSFNLIEITKMNE